MLPRPPARIQDCRLLSTQLLYNTTLYRHWYRLCDRAVIRRWTVWSVCSKYLWLVVLIYIASEKLEKYCFSPPIISNFQIERLEVVVVAGERDRVSNTVTYSSPLMNEQSGPGILFRSTSSKLLSLPQLQSRQSVQPLHTLYQPGNKDRKWRPTKTNSGESWSLDAVSSASLY